MKMIVVVDSLAFSRELLSLALRRAGYTVLAAADGIEALDLIRAKTPDLVLLESRLPHLDGLAVARAMRFTPELKKIPLFMLSATEDRQQIIQAVRAGVQEYILKSQFSLEDLLARLARYVGTPTIDSLTAPIPSTPDATISWSSADPASHASLDILGEIEPCTPLPNN